MDLALLALRVVGAVFVAGGALAGWRATSPRLAPAGPQVRRGPADDPERRVWRIVGATLYMLAGAAMVSGRDASVALLAALVVQQGFYITRQALVAASHGRKSSQADAAPSSLTKAAFLLTSAVAVYAAWLEWAHLLR
jgi:hypothetical protein